MEYYDLKNNFKVINKMMNPFEKIPANDLQFFKEKVQHWIQVDRQIDELQKKLRELKKVRDKELEPQITVFMNNNNVPSLNIDTGKLAVQERKTKKGLNKQNIRENLSKYLTEQDKLDEAVDRIIKEREVVVSYKLKKLKK
tara:strand:+ start:429 stop:851 length:423 start_codon:yes stop_codon:yes gene_type:complete